MSELTDYLQEVFRETGRRLTSQRRLILEVLESSDEHLEAEALYNQAKELDPNVSLPTVYRTLAILKEMGLVEEHRLGEEHSHYEFDTPLVAQIERELGTREGIQVLSAHLHLSGYCAQCQNNAKGKNNGKE